MKNVRYYPFERNRYFYGKLMTVRDFEAEQKYFNDKRRLLNRLMYGGGVVSGLHVSAIDDQTISVEMGLGLDHLGREILVPSPVTTNLSLVEGFSETNEARLMYLCLAYDEKDKESVHSITTAAAGVSEDEQQSNRVAEGYRLFIRSNEPDMAFYEDININRTYRFVYRDSKVSIWQISPKIVEPGKEFEVLLRIQKNSGVSGIQFEFTPVGENAVPVSGDKVVFNEPERNQQNVYLVSYTCRAGEKPNSKGRVYFKDGSFMLGVKGNMAEKKTSSYNELTIAEGPVDETIINNYMSRTLDRALEFPPEQCIYLARIYLVRLGEAFIIEKVDQVPFGEYIYSPALLYSVYQLEKEKNEKRVFSAKSAVKLLKENAEPSFDVDYDAANSAFMFNLGLPGAGSTTDSSPAEKGINTGRVEVNMSELLENSKIGFIRARSTYYTSEIEHGLGIGPVAIQLGIEEHNEGMLEDIKMQAEQIFYGDPGVFKGSEYEGSIPRFSTGAVVYPDNGTFRIGLRFESNTRKPIVNIRWWAWKINEK